MSDTMRDAPEPVKIEPGSDMHLTVLMAPDSLNLVVGEDRAALLRYAKRVWQAAQSQPALMKLPKLPEPDTTHYAQWAGDRIKYHSVDQIIEFANARVTAAIAAAQKGKS